MFYIYYIYSYDADVYLRFNDISAIIPAGVNVAYICTQVKASVDEEQSKALWIPRGGP